jgi:ribosome-associated protein
VSDPNRQILDRCTELLQSIKGEDVLVLDLRDVADFTDYFLISTGNSDVHVKALADAVLEGMKGSGHRPWHIEGYEGRTWILFDFVDVVVHIFQPEARVFYGLERLWGDAPAERIEEDPSLVETP